MAHVQKKQLTQEQVKFRYWGKVNLIAICLFVLLDLIFANTFNYKFIFYTAIIYFFIRVGFAIFSMLSMWAKVFKGFDIKWFDIKEEQLSLLCDGERKLTNRFKKHILKFIRFVLDFLISATVLSILGWSIWHMFVESNMRLDVYQMVSALIVITLFTTPLKCYFMRVYHLSYPLVDKY